MDFGVFLHKKLLKPKFEVTASAYTTQRIKAHRVTLPEYGSSEDGLEYVQGRLKAKRWPWENLQEVFEDTPTEKGLE